MLGKRDDPLDLLWEKYFQKLWGGNPEEHQSVVEGWLGPWIDGGTGTYTPAEPEPKAVDRLGLRLELGLLDEIGGSSGAETRTSVVERV